MFGKQTQTSTATASGSGIIISEDGYILTNNHIVATSSSESYYEVSEATKVTVTLFNDDTEYEAKIVGKDEQTDLAVIKIEKTGLPKAEFADSDNIKVGEFAMAVGNPLGMQSSITCGVVSAVNREVTDSEGKQFTLIQTDAAINSGNSGGALVNSEGKVIEEAATKEIFLNPKNELTREFVSHITPERERKNEKLKIGDRQVVRLNFPGDQADKPYISELVKKFGLDLNILGGSIDDLTDASIGHLLVEFLGNDEDRNNAIIWLKDNKIEVEEI